MGLEGIIGPRLTQSTGPYSALKKGGATPENVKLVKLVQQKILEK